jgi:spermidine synthase
VTMALAMAVVAATGFISLSYEILWYRGISFVTGGSPSAFGMLLGFYLSGLAVGSFASGIFCERAAHGDRRYLAHVAGFVLLANLFGFLALPLLAWLTTRSAPQLAFGLIALASAMLGAVLPLVSHFGVAPDRWAGTRLSYLYAANIVGSVLGSFLTGFVLLDVMPMRVIAALLLTVGVATSATLLAFAGVRGVKLVPALGLLGVLMACSAAATPALFDRFYERLLWAQNFTPQSRFADVVENRSGVIAVANDRTVFGGGVYDGSISTDPTNDQNQITRAYAVAAMHAAPSRVLMIGLSAGAWAQVIANNPGVDSLVVVEINPGYLQLIARYPQVSSILTNPKVRIIIDDGRRWLSRHPDEHFDLILSNTTFHWRANVTNLLSLEFLKLVAAHLRPKGIYYFNTTGSTTALKTAMTAFPFGMRFRNFAAVGPDSFTFDRSRWAESLRSYRIDGRPVFDLQNREGRQRLTEVVSDPEWESRANVLMRLADVEITTDDNMRPEWYPDR